MKKLMFLPVIVLLLATASCGGGKAGQTSGLRLGNLDTNAVPGTDFYQFACGGWMKANPLGDQYARFGSFDKLVETNTERINGLIGEIASRSDLQGSEAKVALLYNMAMDSTKLNADGAAPVAGYLAKIDSVSSIGDLQAVVAELMRGMFDPYFFLFASIDEKNSSKNILQTFQSGLSLGNRDYYLSDDESNKSIRDSYVQYVADMFALAGYDAAGAEEASKSVMRVETSLAEAHFDNLRLRDPYQNYHKMSYPEFKDRFSGMDWDSFMAAIGLASVDSINVAQIEPLEKAVELMTEGSLEEILPR